MKENLQPKAVKFVSAENNPQHSVAGTASTNLTQDGLLLQIQLDLTQKIIQSR